MFCEGGGEDGFGQKSPMAPKQKKKLDGRGLVSSFSRHSASVITSLIAYPVA